MKSNSLSPSFSGLLLQSGTEHVGIFSSQNVNETYAADLYKYQKALLYQLRLDFRQFQVGRNDITNKLPGC